MIKTRQEILSPVELTDPHKTRLHLCRTLLTEIYMLLVIDI